MTSALATPVVGNSVLNSASTTITMPNSINDKRQNAQFPTLNPPTMQTLIYAPDVNILIAHDAQMLDLSQDIVRGQVVRKENSASNLFWTVANPDLRYTSGIISRMDRVTCFLTRVNKIQTFSGYLDTIPWMQAYPGTVDFAATCTIKRLLHTWWNPGLPQSLTLFNQIDYAQGSSDSGISKVLENILTQVGNWSPSQIHIQQFPQEFMTFLNNYMALTNMSANNAALGQQFNELLVGPDQSPGPMAAVGYQASDPVGAPLTAVNANTAFYVSQIAAAVDARGMGPIVDTTANDQTQLQTGAALESALSPQVQKAGQSYTQYVTNQVIQNSNSDAAILALACVMVESGGGSSAAIRMTANSLDPASLTYFNEGLSTNGSSEGLFQQQATGGAWGTTQQRMNPFSSAGMFLDKLNAVTGWRNMDPGQAIQAVQNGAATNVALYDAAVPEASKVILAYRTAQQGATGAVDTALAQVPGLSAAVTGLGGGTNPIATGITTALGVATTSPTPAAAANSLTGRPNPDSEGAINAAYSMLGTPYSQTIGGGDTPGVGLDCSGLVQNAFKAIGVNMARNTYGQVANGQPIPPAQAQRGDVLQTDGGGHTGIYLGGGLWIQTGGPDGTPGSIQSINPATAFSARRQAINGGQDPAAPWTNPLLMGPGNTPGTGSAGINGTGGDPSGDEPIARNLFSYVFEPQNYISAFADLVTGEKTYIDGQPLMQVVTALAGASLRNFQSSPTGDLIFYYPDPFGMDGKPAIWDLQDIELKDCHIDLSDIPMVTHAYVEGDLSMIGEQDSATGWLTTSGVATVENQWLYQRLIQAAPGDVDSQLSAQQLMNRFGVRPYRQTYQLAGNADLEFLLACQIFMGKWAAQYQTQMGMTFMPELYPGMRMNLVGHNLAVYVTQVVHTFDWEQGFSTTATVAAAGNPKANSAIYSSMPGFLNPVQSAPAASNTQTTGAPVSSPGFAAPIAGGPLDSPAGGFGSPSSGFPGVAPFKTVSPQ